MSTKQYKEELPDGCPPPDAEEIQSIVFYRLVESIPPTEKDFLSLKALNPSKDQKYECEARAVSVSVELNGAVDLLKLPTQKGKKIVQLNLDVNTGMHKRTFSRPHHHSWWIYSTCDPLSYCQAVKIV
jgi:hypothetical protein